MGRGDLVGIARETQAICEAGRYAPDARAFTLINQDGSRPPRADVEFPPAKAKLIPPDMLADLEVTRPGPTRTLTLTAESTLAATHRLASESDGVVVLNFASARNIGGGWLDGANAQEESLCRASSLAASLETQPGFYKANRAHPSAVYTDLTIVSRGVTFFRDDAGTLLGKPTTATVITCPAPNAGALLGTVARVYGDSASARAEREAPQKDEVREALRRRARNIVLIASNLGCKHLILGAWGCGVFRNEPEEVAKAFKLALAEIDVGHAVFAILGPDGLVHEIFRQVLSIPSEGNVTVFVSGHLTVSDAEFAEHYVPALERALAAGASFVVGDARGADQMAQRWLSEHGAAKVTVFHMFESPRCNEGGFPLRGGYCSDDERDAAMTTASTEDLAWVRPGREKSGTAKNLARRLR